MINTAIFLKILLASGVILGSAYLGAYAVRGVKALKQHKFEQQIIKRSLENENDCAYNFDAICD